MSDYKEFKATQMSTKQLRRAYLVTYGQADLKLFLTRESFSFAVAEASSTGAGENKVNYFACALKKHKEGAEHFHTPLKLSELKQWLSAKNALSEKYETVVNFPESHGNYYNTYKYIWKTYTDVYHSADHPNLQEI